MPQATDLTIKNAANVDKTFTLISPAAGDGSVAEWALKEGTIPSIFPRLTHEAHRTNNASRKATSKFVIPSSYTEVATGLTKVNNRAEVNVSVSIPDDFPVALRPDLAVMTKNIIATTLWQAMMQDATSAT